MKKEDLPDKYSMEMNYLNFLICLQDLGQMNNTVTFESNKKQAVTYKDISKGTDLKETDVKQMIEGDIKPQKEVFLKISSFLISTHMRHGNLTKKSLEVVAENYAGTL